MTAGVDAVVVQWLLPPGQEPSAEAQRALAAWGRARGVKLSEPTEEKTPALAIDPNVAARVDELLDKARDATLALDADATDRALARAEEELRAHPELPQAAWLMAEVQRAWATRFSRVDPRDPDRATRAWARAAALDGGRVAGVAEAGVAAPSTGAGDTSATIVVPANGRAWIDGATRGPGSVAVAPGLHAVAAIVDGAPVWADWVSVAPNATFTLPSFGGAPCARADLDRARLVDAGVVVASGVRCGAWVAAAPAPNAASAIRVATCAADRCGPLVEWRGGAAALPFTPPPIREKATWPSWATWTVVGAGAAAIAATVLVSTGAFSSTHTETRFVNGGVHPSRFLFPLP